MYIFVKNEFLLLVELYHTHSIIIMVFLKFHSFLVFILVILNGRQNPSLPPLFTLTSVLSFTNTHTYTLVRETLFWLPW